jgi:zinc protease
MWRVGLALLVVGACTIELGTRPRPPPPPPHTTSIGLTISTTTLPSGLRVVTVLDPRATEVQVTMRYQVGASSDVSRPGLAHLVEHLMFQQELDGQTLFAMVEDTATYFNAATTFDATTYVSRGSKSTLDKLLAVEAHRIEQRCQGISDAAFAREREVVLNEIEQRDQATEVYRAIHAALYEEGHPYRRAIGGTATTVGAITRDQACAFAEAYYAPNNAVLVVSGPLTRAEIDAAIGAFSGRVSKRTGAAPRPLPATHTRPQHVEVAAPIDEDVLVLAWPLPTDLETKVAVRAVGAALPRLVDGEIKGSAVALELGDGKVPMFGLAVLPSDEETFKQVVDGTRRGVERLPRMFRESQPDNLDEVLFDRAKQGAIYNLYASLEDGSGRDELLADAVLAGSDPNTAISKQLAVLRGITRDDAVELAERYFAANAPTVITLKAGAAKKRGDKTTLGNPIHDLGLRRTPIDPAAASRPAPKLADATPVAPRTRVLRNGLKVVLLPVTTVPTFEARLIFRAGTADEPVGLKGVALVAAHTLTWNLRHRDDVFAFVRAGGLRDTDVGPDRTSFIVQGVDQNFDVVLAGLRRWVCDGVYDDSAANFLTAMNRATKRSNDQGALTDAWRASLFGANHPYVQAGIARHANPALTLQDARGFRGAYFTPDNATLVIAGRFDPAIADRWIDFLFTDWSGRAAGRTVVQPTPQATSIAKSDDTSLVQLRLAIPAKRGTRAERLVIAAMLSDIARDVRHRLGASYTFDAQLAESRLSSYYFLAGFVDAPRAKEAVELIRDRILELQRDATAAARAFVIARGHVVTQLHSRIGSASALASRVERDVEMEFSPLSDLATADVVAALTIEGMRAPLDELDLARSTILMNGPTEHLEAAYAVLGRRPAYVQPVPAAASTPANTAPQLFGAEQRVLRSELQPALTLQPPPRLLWTASATVGAASIGADSNVFSGYQFIAGAGYRYGWTNAVGGSIGVGRFTTETSQNGTPVQNRLVPFDLLATWHLGGSGRTWAAVLLGLHLQRLQGNWSSAPLYGLCGGIDIVGHLGLTLRWEQAYERGGYSALSVGLAYRR